MKITDVTPQKNKNRLNIYVDNKFYCGMEAEVFVSSRLKIGNDVSIEKMQELALISDREVAKNKALNYISKRCKSVKEVREYLNKKGYLENVVDNVINFLTDYGYLNDEEYQKMFINSNKYRGKKAIKYKLVQKGIDKDMADNAIEQIGSQVEVIEQLLKKYIKNKENSKENLSKAYRYLMGKGFESEEIISVINKYRSE